MCFILQLANARVVLLSALARTGNDCPISFMMACAKIKSAESAPRACSSDSPLDKTNGPCPYIRLSREQVQKVLFLVTGSPAQSESEYPVMLFNTLLKSLGSIAGIVK